METWILALIAAAVVLIIGLVLARVLRRRRLKERFGPEYDRSVEWSDSRAEAERELAERLHKHMELDLRPIEPDAALAFADRWNEVQLAFVELPEGAVAQAQVLVEEVMEARGYPADAALDERIGLVSVDHPKDSARFREGFRMGAQPDGSASTEEFRGALLAYRGLFITLLERDPDDLGKDDDDNGRDDDGGRDDDDATARRIPASQPPDVPDRRAEEMAGHGSQP